MLGADYMLTQSTKGLNNYKDGKTSSSSQQSFKQNWQKQLLIGQHKNNFYTA